MFLSDFHFHTEHSFDGHGTLTETVREAAARGFSELCVTDHFECAGDYAVHNTPVSVMRETYLRAVARNAAPIRLLFGIELGEPSQNTGAAGIALNDGRFDFVIASVHNVDGYPDFYELDYNTVDFDDIMDKYYRELNDICDWNRFDVLGHVNYPERYAAKFGMHVDMSKYFDALEALFRRLVTLGRGIEVNTSKLATPFGKTTPDLAALKLYRACGGEIITMGSDSHSAQTIGQNIPQALEMLKTIGYEYVTVFEGRTPRFVKID